MEIPASSGKFSYDLYEKYGFTGNGDWVPIFLYNIGLGVAESVKVTLDYDMETFGRNLESIGNLTLEKMGKAMRFQLDNKSEFILFRVDFLEKASLDFLLPSHIDKNPGLIRLSSTYLAFMNPYLYYSIMDPNNRNCDFKGIPELKMNISYKDIGSNEYSEDYVLKPCCDVSYNGPEPYVKGHFTIRPFPLPLVGENYGSS